MPMSKFGPLVCVAVVSALGLLDSELNLTGRAALCVGLADGGISGKYKWQGGRSEELMGRTLA